MIQHEPGWYWVKTEKGSTWIPAKYDGVKGFFVPYPPPGEPFRFPFALIYQVGPGLKGPIE